MRRGRGFRVLAAVVAAMGCGGTTGGRDDALPGEDAPVDGPFCECGPIPDVPVSVDVDPAPDNAEDSVVATDPAGVPDAPACVPPELTPCPATACGPVEDLADSKALLAYLGAVTWNVTAPACTVMGEVRIAGSHEVAGDSFLQPDWCVDGDCPTRFRMDPPVPGIRCLDPSGGSASLCNRVEIRDAQFRVRASRWFVDGFAPRTFALIEFLGPCDSPCSMSEITCPNHTCWTRFLFYCAGCLGGSADVCSCRDADGPLADGTECFWSSGDIMGRGRCECGVCIH